MNILKILGTLSPIHISWFTWISRPRLVGKDSAGNVYYESKPRPGYKRPRRWVVYAGNPDASSVPPEWHGWLHYQTDTVPAASGKSYRQEWQKPHKPNMTGTSSPYRPPGHVLEKGTRPSATGDYEAWTPPE